MQRHKTVLVYVCAHVYISRALCGSSSCFYMPFLTDALRRHWQWDSGKHKCCLVSNL